MTLDSFGWDKITPLVRLCYTLDVFVPPVKERAHVPIQETLYQCSWKPERCREYHEIFHASPAGDILEVVIMAK